MQTIELSDFQGNLDSLLGRERCEKRGTGSPFGLLLPVEQGELVPLLDCCCPWSRGNWFPFWIAAARGAGGTGSPFGLLPPVEQGELVPLFGCARPLSRRNWFPF